MEVFGLVLTIGFVFLFIIFIVLRIVSLSKKDADVEEAIAKQQQLKRERAEEKQKQESFKQRQTEQMILNVEIDYDNIIVVDNQIKFRYKINTKLDCNIKNVELHTFITQTYTQTTPSTPPVYFQVNRTMAPLGGNDAQTHTYNKTIAVPFVTLYKNDDNDLLESDWIQDLRPVKDATIKDDELLFSLQLFTLSIYNNYGKKAEIDSNTINSIWRRRKSKLLFNEFTDEEEYQIKQLTNAVEANRNAFYKKYKYLEFKFSRTILKN